jgi:hypothetical protein
MKAIMRHIRTKCRAEYIGAYEVGAEKNGLHCHMFVIIETAKHFPSDLLDIRQGGFIARRIKHKTKGHSIRIEPPKNRMHGEAMFARMNTPAKLENCINWCTYILKPRSKDDVPGRETYFGSEFVSNVTKREAQRQKHRDALLKSSKPALTLTKEQDHEAKPTTKPETLPPFGSPADEEGARSSEGLVCTRQPTSSASEEAGSQQEASFSDKRYSDVRATAYYESPSMRLSAAQQYICGLYEQAIGLDLDTDQIRRYLLKKGVVKTPGTVAWELEHLFGFTGYADSHQPKPQPSMREWLRAGRSGTGRLLHQAV